MSLLLAASLLVVVPQGPEAPVPHRVVVELRGGGEVAGDVIAETDAYLELRLAQGAVVGFDKRRIANRRSVQPVAAPAEPVATVEPKDSWFAVHDAAGVVVGRMHATMATNEAGRLRIGEEWFFHDGDRDVAITRLEIATPSFEPVSCFYHERTLARATGRSLQERLVRATVVGEQLEVETITGSGRDRTTHPWQGQRSFPLTVMAALRIAHPRVASVSVTEVFVPERGQIVALPLREPRLRRVELADGARMVRELAYGGAGEQNREWLDAVNNDVMRRELSGPELVAVRVSEAASARQLMRGETAYPTAVATEAERSFGFYLPDPSWRIAQRAPGSVLAESALHGATACMMAFDHIDQELALVSASDVIVRWLRQVKPGFEVASRDEQPLRGRPAVRITGAYEDARAGIAARFHTELWVLRVRGRTLAVCFDAPYRRAAALRSDIDRVLSTLELFAEGVPNAMDAATDAVVTPATVGRRP